tara:strand:+ start:6739 stop:7632 length:894 start_codon:yes stop_codon:yes gene_type:complete
LSKIIQKWSNNEYQSWRNKHTIQRSYQEDIVTQIEKLKAHFKVEQYGELKYPEGNYPLFRVMTKEMAPDKPNILITGGVHGYETSGPHGALKFLSEKASDMEKDFNFVCYPCISPWGYETINRWNPEAIDPNRNFFKDSPAQECAAIYHSLAELNLKFLAHIDLHETTDTDNTVFRPDLEKRDGVEQELWEIPDGFYLVADSGRKSDDFQKAMIESVSQVTHIAPSDAQGKIIGKSVNSPGVIEYDVSKLHLCAGLTDAPYVTTTEVYPDSPKVTDAECNAAQVAAIMGGLEYLKSI